MGVRKLIFSVTVTCLSRVLIVRARLHGKARIGPGDGSTVETKVEISRGREVLDGWLVRPREQAPRAAVLLCHGIGETVEDWRAVQRLLAKEGVASLVFDYAGYGRSTGWVSAAGCERDGEAAFACLATQVPGVPLSLLGFSLGSGVAAAISGRVAAHGLILCAPYTTFREAGFGWGRAARWMRGLAWMLPAVWDTREALRTCRVPILLVHGDRDWLFPVRMAEELARACGSACDLVVVPGLGHDDPVFRAERGYWSGVAEWIGN